MRRALALTVLFVATAAHAQSGTFRRWMRSLSSTRRVSAPLTSVNCTGAAQTLNDGSAITWTRATAATCTKDDGTLTGVTSGQPRCNSSGCFVEAAATNVLQRSEAIDNAYWTGSGGGLAAAPTVTADTSVAPDGATTADRVQTAVVGAVGDQSVRFSGVFAATAAAYTASCYIKGTSGSGAVPLQFVTSAFGSAAGQALISYTTTWARYSITATLTAVNWRINIGYSTSVGAAYVTGAGAAQDFQLWGCQIQLGSFPSSYIPTTNASVTRNADAASFAKPAWFSDGRGCTRARVTFEPGFTTSGTAPRILAMGATNTLLHINSAYDAVGVTDGTNSAFFSKTLTGTPAIYSTLRSYWSPSGLSITDGSSINTNSYDGSILSGSTISLGSAQGSTNFLHGWISNIRLANKPTGCL